MKSVSKLWQALLPFIRKNNFQRWVKVSQEMPSWDARNRLIASIIPPMASALDIGAGAQTLRRHLREPSRYTPCDLVQSTPDTILCDFNNGRIPSGLPVHDFAICSGVLEYIRTPSTFLRFLREHGKQVILSYNVRLPEDSLVDRLANDWVNHFSDTEIRLLLDSNGLHPSAEHPFGQREVVFVLKPNA